MRLRLFALLTVVALFLPACGGSPTEPTPTGTGNPVVTFPPPVTVDTLTSALTVVTPRQGSVIRDGDVVEVTIQFHLPAPVYPTSVATGIVYKNKVGTVSGTSSCVQRLEHAQILETLRCRIRLADYYNFLRHPEFGVAAGEKVDVDLRVFNWSDQRHPGDTYYNNIFRTGYVFQP